MRTTIRLEDALLRRAKARAAERGVSLNEFIGDAIRAALHRKATQSERFPIPVFGGGRLLPGVDLDDSAALLELMEQGGPSAAYSEARNPSRRRIAEPGAGGGASKPRRRRK